MITRRQGRASCLVRSIVIVMSCVPILFGGRKSWERWAFIKEKNKRAIINSYRSHRAELLAQTVWTQTEDCPLDIHKKEMYRAYRKFLRDFPQTRDPEVDENGEVVHIYKLPETLDEFALESKL